MAAQTDSYSSVVSGIEALAGDSLTDIEKARLKFIINQRARVAYRLFDAWPEFTTVKEQRIVRGDGGVDKVDVDGIGTEVGNDHIDTFLQFYEKEPFDDQSVCEFDHYEQDDKGYPVGYEDAYSSNDDLWMFSAYIAAGLLVFQATSFYNTAGHPFNEGDKFKLSGFTQLTGDAFDINGLIWTVFSTDKWTGSATAPGSIDIATATYSPTIPFSSDDLVYPQVWCSYKERLTATYGDAVGETSTVPRRWTDYLIRASYADFLRADGQSEKALAEEAIAQELLDREIYMLDRQPNFNAHKIRMATHASRGRR